MRVECSFYDIHIFFGPLNLVPFQKPHLLFMKTFAPTLRTSIYSSMCHDWVASEIILSVGEHSDVPGHLGACDS